MDAFDGSLTPRVEGVRNENPVLFARQFTPEQIYVHFREGVDDVRQQIDVSDSVRKFQSPESADNILRDQIVRIESIFDFYIHEVVKFGLHEIFQCNVKTTTAFNKIQVPLSEVKKALSTEPPSEWFFTFISSKNSTACFMSLKNVTEQLNGIGLNTTTIYSDACSGYSSNTKLCAKESRERIASLYRRRNCIAHQGDRSHDLAERQSISQEYVKEQLEFIERLVAAIDKELKTCYK